MPGVCARPRSATSECGVSRGLRVAGASRVAQPKRCQCHRDPKPRGDARRFLPKLFASGNGCRALTGSPGCGTFMSKIASGGRGRGAVCSSLDAHGRSLRYFRCVSTLVPARGRSDAVGRALSPLAAESGREDCHMRRSRVSPAELVVLIALVAILVIILLPRLYQVPDRSHLPSCQNNLKQLAVMCTMYANEMPGHRYPPLQCPCPVAGQEPLLFPDTMAVSLSVLYPEYCCDLRSVLCPSRADLGTSRLRGALEARERARERPMDPCVVLPTSYVYYAWRFVPEMVMAKDGSGEAFRTELGEALRGLARGMSASPGGGQDGAYDKDLVVGERVIPWLRGAADGRGAADVREVVLMQERPVKGTTSAVPLELPDHSGRRGRMCFFWTGMSSSCSIRANGPCASSGRTCCGRSPTRRA